MSKFDEAFNALLEEMLSTMKKDLNGKKDVAINSEKNHVDFDVHTFDGVLNAIFACMDDDLTEPVTLCAYRESWGDYKWIEFGHIVEGKGIRKTLSPRLMLIEISENEEEPEESSEYTPTQADLFADDWHFVINKEEEEEQ